MRLLAALVTGGALLTLNFGLSPTPRLPRALRADDGARQLAARVSYDCGAALLARARRADGVDAELLDMAARQFRACLACTSAGDASGLVRDARQKLKQAESLLDQARRPAPAREATTVAAGTAERGPRPSGPERLPAPREAPQTPAAGPDSAPSDKAPPLPRVRPQETSLAAKPDGSPTEASAHVVETPAPQAPPPEGKMVGPDGIIFQREPAATH